MTMKGQEQNRKYDPLTWKTTGENRKRNLKNISFSLNEDDYENPSDYEWDKLIVSLISNAITDIARYKSTSYEYISAHNFIFGEDLDMWCIAFGCNVNTDHIRVKAKKIIMSQEERDAYLRYVYEQQKYEKHIHRRNNKKLQADGVSEAGDTELPLGDEDSSG